MGHEVAVGAVCEAFTKTLEVGVRQREVEHLDVPKSGQVEAGDLAVIRSIVIGHEVAVGVVGEAAPESLEVAVRRREVEHLDVPKSVQVEAGDLAVMRSVPM